MKLNIAVLPGDGIGPEIAAQGVEVMSAVCKKFGHEVRYEYALCGADAIDKVGDPFPEETYEVCKNADAVLFSAVGDPKFDNDPTAKVRPEQGLLAMRKKLGLFANIRPVQTFKCLIHKSPLRAELVENADWMMCEAFCKYADRDVFHPYEKHHSTAMDAAMIAQQLNVKNLVLYHTEEKTIATRKREYTLEAKTKFYGNVFVPDDLDEIML